MASVIETIKCHCVGCGHKQTVNVDLFERFESREQAQSFVDETFVRRCDNCSACSWKLDKVLHG